MKNSSSKTDVRYECIRILREIDEKEIFAQELISEKCSQVDWLPHPDKNPSAYMAANYSHPEWLLKRLQLVQENCRRMGVQNVFIVCGDASGEKVPFRVKFDRVLIDAPCSNTGVFSRRVEARWRLKEEDINKLTTLQYSILKTGAAMLKPGGYLVYSTCSIESEENQDIIKKFLSNEPQFSLNAEEYYLPTMNAGDGGYMARVYKRKA